MPSPQPLFSAERRCVGPYHSVLRTWTRNPSQPADKSRVSLLLAPGSFQEIDRCGSASVESVDILMDQAEDVDWWVR